jgi:exosortase K
MWRTGAQLLAVLLCALGLKLFYSTASPDELRWILAPTTLMVELTTGVKFQFESHAGYMSGDHTFLIAASCAGVNFLLTAFLMLSLRKLWRRGEERVSWSFLPTAAVFSYLATLVANTARISIALRLHNTPPEISWLSQNQLHRFEGIFVYFGFLLLLFVLSERNGRTDLVGLVRQSLFPLAIYYVTTLGIPLVNGAFHRANRGPGFLEHSVFVLIIPLLTILIVAGLRFLRPRNLGTHPRAQSFFSISIARGKRMLFSR